MISRRPEKKAPFSGRLADFDMCVKSRNAIFYTHIKAYTDKFFLLSEYFLNFHLPLNLYDQLRW
jgi:hypothetical protein